MPAGKFFQILGRNARSDEFTLDLAKLPDSTRAAWGAIRDGFRRLRTLREEFGADMARIESDHDLTPDARKRRTAEVVEKARASVQAALENALAKVREAQAALAEVVEKERQGPLAPPVVRFRDLGPREEEFAKIGIRLFERLASVERRLVEQRADALLAAAFAADDGTGQRLLGELDAVLGGGDLLLADAITGGLRSRLAAHGTQAQRAILEQRMAQVAEEALSEGAGLALDHQQALGQGAMLLEAAASDVLAGVGDFVSGRRKSVVLAQVESFLGPELAGAA